MRFMPGVVGGDVGGGPSGIIGAIGVRSDAINFIPAIVGQNQVIAPLGAYSGVTAFAPVLSEPSNGSIIPALGSYSGITGFSPSVLSGTFSLSILDDWADQGVTVSIGAPGSRSFSPGPNRLLVAHVVNVGATAQDITALSYGGQAMTLVEDSASTVGRDMDSSAWILGEAGLAAAVGTAFVATPSSGSVQFRLRSAVYENIDQADPIVSSADIQSVSAGDDPIPTALTTVSDSVAIAAASINAGTADDGVEDVVFSNMSERVQDDASSNQYTCVSAAATNGSNFTPALTTTQTARITHLIQMALRSSTGSPNGVVTPPLGAYSGITALLPAMAEAAPDVIIPPLGAYSGITALSPSIDDITIQAPLGAYSGVTNPAQTVTDITIQPPLGSYSGVTALSPTVAAVVAFEPTDLSDLELWLDASDASTITESSGVVSAWDDLSTNGKDLDQGTSGNRPSTSTVNSNDSIDFDGSNDHLDDTGASPSLTGDQFTLAVVFTPTSVTGDNNQFVHCRSAGFADVIRAGRDGDDLVVTIGSGVPPNSLTMTIANILAVDETRWVIIRCDEAATSDLLTDEGDTATGTGPTTIAVQTRVSVGGRDNAAQLWTGHVHEVIYYNQVLSSGDRDDLEAYLDGKWTLS